MGIYAWSSVRPVSHSSSGVQALQCRPSPPTFHLPKPRPDLLPERAQQHRLLLLLAILATSRCSSTLLLLCFAPQLCLLYHLVLQFVAQCSLQ
jgi:hypothetical protein